MSAGSPPDAFIDSNVWLYAFLADDSAKQRAATILLRSVAAVVSV